MHVDRNKRFEIEYGVRTNTVKPLYNGHIETQPLGHPLLEYRVCIIATVGGCPLSDCPLYVEVSLYFS